MPSFTTAQLPKPKSWEEFEDIVSDIIRRDLEDPFASRVGRLGQKQNGVDIYASSRKLNGEKCGIQCKKEESLSIEDIEKAISEAENFSPPLEIFIFATTYSKDVNIQKEVWRISGERKLQDKFEVQILFWEDLALSLSQSYDLMQKHFPQFISNPSSWKNILDIILNSSSEDWLFEDTKGVYTYKQDINLTIRRSNYDKGEVFHESWAKIGLHEGYTSHHEIYYGSSFVKRFYMVAVDSYRAYIPYPTVNDMKISFFQYKFGRIVNDSYKYRDQFGVNWFDNYLKKCGISVKK